MRGFSAVVAGVLLVAPTACHRVPQAPRADKAWVRLPAVPGNPAAAYFTLHGAAAPDTLLKVSSAAALRAEMHESMTRHGMMRMAPIGDVPLPAGGEIAFVPGGRHVMLFSVGPAAKAGGTIPLTIALASGTALTVQAKVIGAGDPAPE
jgi:periplasmic copper chaperone A